MSGSVRWAVIGSGGIARRRTIPEGIIPAHNAQLVSVYGTNAVTNKKVAQQFGARACDSIEELLSSAIDAVYIASPNHAHLVQVLACAKAGKHVLCEKPLGMNVAEAEQMLAACKAAKVQLGVAFMMRFQGQHQAALELIQQGKLGKPVFARAQLSCWYPKLDRAWRQKMELAGGGSLIDMGSHCIDLLEMFFGPVRKVSCFTSRAVHDYETEDSATVMLSFSNGALGTVDTFFCIQDDSSKNVLELYGSRGSILATGTIGQSSVGKMSALLRADDGAYDAQQTRSSEKGQRIDPDPRNTYRAEIETFSQALLDGKPNPLTAENGLRNQRLIAACYESARLGKAIEVSR